ncbi:MAG TPA: GNAT family N-acetyltransferase, partial [Pyrinomonadaceae bacterium]|nr:GNAT family N-acetyltransferase [Pyrinomonadaceae bacterium]
MSLTEQAISERDQDVSIARMTEHDLLEVVDIEESSGLSRWGWAAYYAELQGSNKHLMLVARLGEGEDIPLGSRLAGYIVARLGADELHINNVAVRDRYRRSGIGRALLDFILAEGKRSGVSRAFLELRAGNAAALALYESCGFRVNCRRGYYFSVPVDDARVMITDLS